MDWKAIARSDPTIAKWYADIRRRSGDVPEDVVAFMENDPSGYDYSKAIESGLMPTPQEDHGGQMRWDDIGKPEGYEQRTDKSPFMQLLQDALGEQPNLPTIEDPVPLTQLSKMRSSIAQQNPLFSTMGKGEAPIMQAMDIVSRPAEALQGAMKAGFNREDMGQAAMAGLRGQQTSGKDIVEAIGKRLFGQGAMDSLDSLESQRAQEREQIFQQHPTLGAISNAAGFIPDKIIGALGGGDPRKLTTILGGGAELGLDPLNALPLLGEAAKGIKTAGRMGLEFADDAVKGFAKLLRGDELVPAMAGGMKLDELRSAVAGGKTLEDSRDYIGGLSKQARLDPEYKETLRVESGFLDKVDDPFANKAVEYDDMIEAGGLDFVNPKLKALQSNAEYKKSAEAAGLCPKAAGCAAARKVLKDSIGSAKWSPEQSRKLWKTAHDQGLQVSCPQCYVEGAREKFRGMQKPVEFGSTGYKGELANMSQDVIDQFPEGALRAQSSSDFAPNQIPMWMALIRDASKRGVPMGAYTAKPEMVRVLGPSGMYFNLSVGGKAGEGMDMATALKLREEFPNVGIKGHAWNDDQVIDLIRNENVDHVIPEHVSGASLEDLASKTGEKIQDYTALQQGSIEINGKRYLLSSKKVSKKIKSSLKIATSEHNGDFKKFMAAVKKRQSINPTYRPPFEQFLGEGQNYMKLIGNEYGKHAMFGGDFPYKPVTQAINTKEADSMIAAFNRGEYSTNYKPYIDIAKKMLKDQGVAPVIDENIANVLKTSKAVERAKGILNNRGAVQIEGSGIIPELLEKLQARRRRGELDTLVKQLDRQMKQGKVGPGEFDSQVVTRPTPGGYATREQLMADMNKAPTAVNRSISRHNQKLIDQWLKAGDEPKSLARMSKELRKKMGVKDQQASGGDTERIMQMLLPLLLMGGYSIDEGN